mgnify:CR=1
MTKRANRTRMHYNRTRKKWLIHPTAGRTKAMNGYRKAIEREELLQTIRINPNTTVTFKQLLDVGLFP